MSSPQPTQFPANWSEQSVAARSDRDEFPEHDGKEMAGATGLEPAASCVTGRRSNQLDYAPACDERLIPSDSLRRTLIEEAWEGVYLISRSA